MAHHRRILIACAFAVIAGAFLACSGTAPEPTVPITVEATNATSADRIDARAKARAKAEAEAEAKNEVNRKAYEADVERLKVKHAEKVEKYRIEQDLYDTAFAKFKIERAEVEAGRKLRLARMFLEEKQTEIANRRLREIIKDYPDTQAAKDATILLSNGYVKVRDTSVDPVAPVAPVEPRLVLPAPPTPAAVIYPPDADDEPVKVADESKLPDSDYVYTRSGDYRTPIHLGNGKTVYVKGHYRNGTYVQPHMRSAPGSGSKTTSGGRHK
jgi:hypothetical protein